MAGSKIVPIFRGCSGLNNKVDPHRLQYRAKVGIPEMAVLVDVDIDVTNRVSRRKGNLLVKSATGAHSLWSHGKECFYVAGTTLYQLKPNFTSQAITTVTQGARVGYEWLNDCVVWGNGFETGIVKNGVNSSFVRATGTTRPPTRDDYDTSEWFDPPLGTKFLLWNGRLYVIRENVAFASAVMYFNYFRLRVDRLVFPKDITMFRAVNDGIYVSDKEKAYFAKGETVYTMKRTELEPWASPAIKGSDIIVDASAVTNGKINGPAVMWLSTSAVCCGLADGFVLNLTRDKLVFPHADEAAACFKDGVYKVFLAA